MSSNDSAFMKRLAEKITALLGSRRFTYAVFIFFAFEALWVALSAVYPMAFDEDFHLGVIKIYSHHVLPFLPDGAGGHGQFGAITRDPSYLYHWLMSFPYRLIALFTQSQTIQVIFLRLINIPLFGLGLLLFFKVLRKAGMSRAAANVSLAIFVLIPIVPLLAGQINYDNLLLPITASLCLLVFAGYEDVRQKRINFVHLVLLTCLCLLGSLVKYAFLPMVLAAATFLGIVLVRAFWRDFSGLKKAVVAGYQRVGLATRLGLLVLLLTSSALFIQRYGMNLSAYHTPVPDCDAVLTTDECMSYGPWARNYTFEQEKGDQPSTNPLAYSWTWLQGMHYRLFFMVNGPNSGFINYPPLPLPSAAAICIALFAISATLIYAVKIFDKRPLLVFLLLVSLVYVGVLWADNFAQYAETGQPVAINGRYLLPVMLPLAVIAMRGIQFAFKTWPIGKPLVAALFLLCFLNGGGLISFIERSDSTWDWPSAPVTTLNNGARRILSPIIFDGSKYY